MSVTEEQPNTETPDKDAASPPAKPAQPAKPADPVLGVTVYERVTSFLLTWIFIGLLVVAPFGALWFSNQKWQWFTPKPPPKIDLVDIIADVEGGGDEAGALDSSLYAPGPDGPDVSTAATSDDVISDAPSVENTVTAVLSAMGAAVEISDTLMVGTDIGSSALPSGNTKGKGNRRNLGKGPGDGGGVKRQDRWEITFDQGQTEKEYARQLDFFGVELGAIVGGKMYLVSNLSADKPIMRELTATGQEKRLYFSWRGGSRRQVDVSLLGKAGVPVGGNIIVLQLYPDRTEQLLAHLERDEAQRSGKALKEGKLRMEVVRKTKFAVEKQSTGYRFQITKIDYFGDAPSK